MLFDTWTSKNASKFVQRFTIMLVIVQTSFVVAASAATVTPAKGAGPLLAKYDALKTQLQKNQFNRPLYLDSTESKGNLKGDIYAVLNYPFSEVTQSFKGPEHWCDMLILHLNTKYCRSTNDSTGPRLLVNIGKKDNQPLNETYRVAFSFFAPDTAENYLDVMLNADEGPMGTRDYKIVLEAVPLSEGKSFIHLTYSYGYGMAAQLAMSAYLSTIGSDKVGFTRSGTGNRDAYIGGVRGVVERNTMRYYLAIDSYLSAINVPPGQQLDRRLSAWFDATERYPRQLREIERDDYLEMKKSEHKRQQTAM